MDLLKSSTRKTKEEGLADSPRDQVTITDLHGKYVSWKEGSCENQTWETINRSMTCYSSRGVESASNRDIKVMGTKNLTPETEFDSIGIPQPLWINQSML